MPLPPAKSDEVGGGTYDRLLAKAEGFVIVDGFSPNMTLSAGTVCSAKNPGGNTAMGAKPRGTRSAALVTAAALTASNATI